jgi:sugar diacid utilization regulator
MAHDPLSAEMEPRLPLSMMLAEPLFKGHVVVGGAAGLSEAISWCLPASEVDADGPSAAGLQPDLTGVAVHVATFRLADGDAVRQLVRRMAKRGAAAVLVWPGSADQPVDLGAAATAAEETGTPLILIPAQADFRHVGQLVAMKVLAQTAHVLEYSARVHRTLGEVFAHGSGLAAMARTMSQLSGTPVYLIGLGGEVLASADVTRPAGAAAPAVGTGQTIVAQLIAQHRKDRAQAEAFSSAPAPHARSVELDLDDARVHAMVAPVTVGGDPYGVVVLVEHTWPAEGHDLAQHAVIAEQGATLLGSELLRQRSVREAEERARDDFVDALLHARFTDQHELSARARHYGFDPERRFAVFVVTARGLEPERRTGTQRAAASARAAAMVAAHPDRLTLTALIGSMIVVIRQLPEGESQSGQTLAERQSLAHFADQLHKTIRDRLGDGVRVAYGRGGVGAAGVSGSYREARTAVALAHRIAAAPVCGYDDLRVFAAIEELASNASGQSLAAEVLGPLRRADGQTGNLEKVVLAYIKESGNLNAAARVLRLHRNTMLSKLDRASRALQMDIRTAETQFMVWLAYHIDTLKEVHAALENELVPPS